LIFKSVSTLLDVSIKLFFLCTYTYILKLLKYICYYYKYFTSNHLTRNILIYNTPRANWIILTRVIVTKASPQTFPCIPPASKPCWLGQRINRHISEIGSCSSSREHYKVPWILMNEVRNQFRAVTNYVVRNGVLEQVTVTSRKVYRTPEVRLQTHSICKKCCWPEQLRKASYRNLCWKCKRWRCNESGHLINIFFLQEFRNTQSNYSAF